MFTSPPFKRADLIAVLTACRDRTLALFGDVTPGEFCQQLHPDFSPLGWHLGHIGFTERLWILEHWAGVDLPPDPLRHLWAADGLPKAQRQQLPDFATVAQGLKEGRSLVLAQLQRDPEPSELPLWCWLLQHESQHNETIAFLKQYHRGLPVAPRCAPLPPPDVGMVSIPGGRVAIGNNSPWGQDNEQPRHWVEVEPFWCDRFPVTHGEYQAFIAAGGYQNRQYWTVAGWEWRSQQGITQPLYWQEDLAWANHPVCGVSHYEAAAYAQFVDKRLPTEAEWETVAGYRGTTTTTYPWGEGEPTANHGNFDGNIGQTTAVNAYPLGQSSTGCWDLLGNVWEWTASPFAPYPGFRPYPYRGYSQAYFDRQHYVMRGGSWATRPWGLRNSLRNWYHPWVREICVGFRCVRSS